MPRYVDIEPYDDYKIVAHNEDNGFKCADLPTADVAPVKHGKFISEIVKKEDWKGRLQSYYQPNSCICCHTPLEGTENYCPNCGAKMDLRSNELKEK